MTLRLRDLTDDERTEVQRITRSHTLGAAVVRRAQIVVHAMSGSVSFQGKWYKFQTDAYQRLYQAAEIKSRSAATRWTWMTRRRASEMVWLMVLVGRRKLRTSSKARQKR